MPMFQLYLISIKMFPNVSRWCILHGHKYFFCKLQCLLHLEAKKCKQKSKLWTEKQNTFHNSLYFFFSSIRIFVFCNSVFLSCETEAKDVNGKAKYIWSHRKLSCENKTFCFHICIGLGSVIIITISELGKRTVFLYFVKVYFSDVSMVGMADGW